MVAIKDMAIPSCCGECDFCADNWECILLRKRTNNIVGANAKLSDCPLVEIEERKVGKWINKSHKSGCGILFVASECTCCRKKTLFNCDELLYNYCPNCGADMRGAGND